MTFSKSAFEDADNRYLLTSTPSRLKPSFSGIKKVECGVVLNRSERDDDERTAAKKTEKSNSGSATVKASDGGDNGREIK